MLFPAFRIKYSSRPVSLAFILCTVLAANLGALALPGAWWLPVLNGGLFYPLFFSALHEGDYAAAAKLSLAWAAFTCLVQICLTLAWPDLMARAVWRGIGYRYEMMNWVRTGTGPEGDIRLFLPVLLRHVALFAALSLASGGFFGLILGSAMLGYMNFYVGSLIAAAGGSWTAVLLGWPVWSVCRVAGFICAGVALGAVIVHRPDPEGRKWGNIRRCLVWALILLLLDLLLKWGLAGVYRPLLDSAVSG
jgi:hypothetical protein